MPDFIDQPELDLSNLHNPAPPQQQSVPVQTPANTDASAVVPAQPAAPVTPDVSVGPGISSSFGATASPVREGVPPLHPFSSSAAQAAPATVPRPPAYAAPGIPQYAVPIAEETIEIAPHPTINRFPWTPVENPKIPIFGAPPPPPAIQLPAQPAPPNMPVQAPVPKAQVPGLQLPIPPEPASPPVPQPVSQPIPQPQPIFQPAQPSPILPPAPKPAPIVQPAPPEQPPAPRPKRPMLRARRPHHIYSDYTQEVWSVFRPSRLVRLMVIGFFVIFIGALLGLWLMSGAPTNIFNLPILQPLLHAE